MVTLSVGSPAAVHWIGHSEFLFTVLTIERPYNLVQTLHSSSSNIAESKFSLFWRHCFLPPGANKIANTFSTLKCAQALYSPCLSVLTYEIQQAIWNQASYTIVLSLQLKIIFAIILQASSAFSKRVQQCYYVTLSQDNKATLLYICCWSGKGMGRPSCINCSCNNSLCCRVKPRGWNAELPA